MAQWHAVAHRIATPGAKIVKHWLGLGSTDRRSQVLKRYQSAGEASTFTRDGVAADWQQLSPITLNASILFVLQELEQKLE